MIPKTIYQLHKEDQMAAMRVEFMNYWFAIGQDLRQKGYPAQLIAVMELKEWQRWSKERKQQQ